MAWTPSAPIFATQHPWRRAEFGVVVPRSEPRKTERQSVEGDR